MCTKKRSWRNLSILLVALGGLGVTSGCAAPPLVELSIDPTRPQLIVGTTQAFTALVTGLSDGRVTWSTTGGFITPEGVYTAPTMPGPYRVTATSVTLPSLSATTTVTVQQDPSIHLVPTEPVLAADRTQAFIAVVTGLTDARVTWSTTGGSITETGLYSAPGTAGRYVVTATSVADPRASASTTVEVTGAGAPLTKPGAHSAHTTTRLSDGRILLAGGVSEPFADVARPVTAAADLFDPSTGQLTRVSNLGHARALHTATLLDDRRVIIAGGEENGTSSLDSIEAFDPVSGTFSPAGTMISLRQGHSATLLRGGRILLAGGYDAIHHLPLSSAELYDPKTGSSTPTGNLNDPRQLHTATLLSDGRVLFAGGVTDRTGALRTAEIYDPETGRFTLVSGGLRAPRFLHGAVALADGRLLITGGSQTLDHGTPGLSSAEVYDPITNQFLPTSGLMAVPRQLHTATLLADGRVVIAGGTSFYGEKGAALGNVEFYDPQTDRFATFVLPLTYPRQRHSAIATLSDRIVLLGGHAKSNVLAVETYPIGPVREREVGPTYLPGGHDGYFPPGSQWARDISQVPLDPESSQVIGTLAALGGWGLGQMRIDFSLNVLEAGADVPFFDFTPTSDFYHPDCDNVPMPVPPLGALEGEAGYQCKNNGDCHLIVVHRASHRLYEMSRANDAGGRNFAGGCLVVWDLNRLYPTTGRGEQCTSADAAGLPIAPLLFNADEIATGHIDHAIRFVLPNARIRAGAYVHPATHVGAPNGPGTAPPFGARFRLRADYPVDRLPNAAARIIARALQRYGMILADGGTIALTAQSDRDTVHKWSGVLGPQDLAQLEVTDFEMIEAGTRLPAGYDCFRNP